MRPELSHRKRDGLTLPAVERVVERRPVAIGRRIQIRIQPVIRSVVYLNLRQPAERLCLAIEPHMVLPPRRDVQLSPYKGLRPCIQTLRDGLDLRQLLAVPGNLKPLP